ncbi:MAG: hypothetical protein CFE34_01590 [Rhodobacteraceae bacterium PARR1]|nr:MAG: hypothetical protein CFE34_01590 [Rhodobacteraceae bacterium PARR1]
MRLSVFAVGLVVSTAPAFAFEPGTLGDAYRDFGYVQGCTDSGELPGCMIIAGGSRFVATADGQTPAEVMAALQAMPPLTYVEFRGDILNVYDSFAEIAVGAVAKAEAGTDPYAATLQAMQGKWVSVDDPKSGVQVDGLLWTDAYGGEAMGQSVMSYYTACSDGTGGDGTVLELFVIGPQESGSLCYSVLTVDAQRMELSYMGRGNTLAYTRAE